MVKHYKGKTAVITGAASGIGLLASRKMRWRVAVEAK